MCHLVFLPLISIVNQSQIFRFGNIFKRWLPITIAFSSPVVSQRPAVMIGAINVDVEGGATNKICVPADFSSIFNVPGYSVQPSTLATPGTLFARDATSS